METALIIADDFTGANATGILIKKKGFKTITTQDYEKIKDYINEYSVICVNIDSRADKEKEAYIKTYDIVKSQYKQHSIICLRIDSTLRGNIGSEIDGALDALGNEYKALVVPAFPDSKRIAVGGFLLVNNLPLELTGVAKDPKTPINSSKISDIITKQCKKSVVFISLEEVLKGTDYLKERLSKIKEQVIIFDAVSNQDIKNIAQASLLAGFNFISVDPGPFSSEIICLTFNNKKCNFNKNINKALLIIGSVTDLTHKQIKYAVQNKKINLFQISPEKLINNDFSDINKVIDYFSKTYDDRHFCITTSFDENDVIDFKTFSEKTSLQEKQIGINIAKGLSVIGKHILDNFKTINFVYTSGGDVTQEFFNTISSDAFEVLNEVMPLTVHGKVKGGIYDGLNLITKGGLIGEEKSLVEIISYLENER